MSKDSKEKQELIEYHDRKYNDLMIKIIGRGCWNDLSEKLEEAEQHKRWADLLRYELFDC